MEAKKRERCGKSREEREMCNCGCVLSHLIVPLFIVVGNVNSLLLQHLISNLLLIRI